MTAFGQGRKRLADSDDSLADRPAAVCHEAIRPAIARGRQDLTRLPGPHDVRYMFPDGSADSLSAARSVRRRRAAPHGPADLPAVRPCGLVRQPGLVVAVRAQGLAGPARPGRKALPLPAVPRPPWRGRPAGARPRRRSPDRHRTAAAVRARLEARAEAPAMTAIAGSTFPGTRRTIAAMAGGGA